MPPDTWFPRRHSGGRSVRQRLEARLGRDLEEWKETIKHAHTAYLTELGLPADGQANGALYARLGAVGLGVELNDSEPALRVLQPKRWFDRWREAQRFPRP